jgi:surface antigen
MVVPRRVSGFSPRPSAIAALVLQTCHGPCWEYSRDANISGNTEQVCGTACRQAEGS